MIEVLLWILIGYLSIGSILGLAYVYYKGYLD
jgi:hypothetical protein